MKIRATASATSCLVVAGLLAACGTSRATTAAAPTSAPASTVSISPTPTPSRTTADPSALPPGPVTAATTSPPVSVSIPAINVSSSLQPLGIEKDGTLESPSEYPRAGWFAKGVRPGDPGPAVIAGHVDSTAGPAVFFYLKQLKPGDVAYVKQQDGHTLKFVVDTVKEYPKDKFPSAAVYGPTALPVLRLITCTGDFDRAAHSYVDNLVVSTHLVTAPNPLG